jgi:hypothetical protein
MKKNKPKEGTRSIIKIRCELERLSTSTMYHAEDLPLQSRIFHVFTQKKNRIRRDR